MPIPDWQTTDGAIRRTTIYALLDPLTREVRYVGKTTVLLRIRVVAHVNTARRKRATHIHRWILSVGKPLIIPLEIVEEGDNWQRRERRWILYFRKKGCRLCNATDGGEGLHGHKLSKSHKERISNKLKTGQTFECEQCSAKFWRKLNAIKKGNCRFCSLTCYFAWQKGKTKNLGTPVCCGWNRGKKTPDSVKLAISKANRVMSPEQLARASELRSLGWPLEKIASDIGVCRRTLSNAFSGKTKAYSGVSA